MAARAITKPASGAAEEADQEAQDGIADAALAAADRHLEQQAKSAMAAASLSRLSPSTSVVRRFGTPTSRKMPTTAGGIRGGDDRSQQQAGNEHRRARRPTSVKPDRQRTDHHRHHRHGEDRGQIVDQAPDVDGQRHLEQQGRAGR